MRYLDAIAVRACLPMERAIDAMRSAFGDDRECPQRRLIGRSLFMPGRVGGISGIKVVSTVPGDPSGLVVVFDANGRPLGVVDGPAITSVRTGAACGLATELLADPGATTLAMLGAGAMAFDQIEAVRAVRPIRRVLVWSRSLAHAQALAARIGGTAVPRVDEAVAAAQVVTTATPARLPLFPAEAVLPGVHVNAIGAFRPDMVELPRGLLEAAFVVVDDRDAAAAEAGDLIQAGVQPDATIGDVLSGRCPRPERTVATVFKSVGIATQDVAAAHVALEQAERLNLGVEL